jgi:hypothetical protein
MVDLAERALNQACSLLLDRIHKLRSWFAWLKQVDGANTKLRRIADVQSKEELVDYLAEISYALILLDWIRNCYGTFGTEGSGPQNLERRSRQLC